MVVVQLEDVEATERLGAQLAECVAAGDVIFLSGELGAGKTALARGFLRRFFRDDALEVPSPSYLICFSYTSEVEAAAGEQVCTDPKLGRTLQPHSGGRGARLPGVRVLHMDPYRLPEGKISSLIDVGEAFGRDVCLVEWPERLGSQLVTDTHPPRLELTLSGVGPQAACRAATLRSVGSRWQPLLLSLIHI